MKPLSIKPFYSISIILLLLAGCGQPPASEEKKPLAATVAKSSDSLSLPSNPMDLLRTAAGKKEGLTQKEIDSLENVSMLRKKF